MNNRNKFNLIRECVSASGLTQAITIELNGFLDELEERQEEEWLYEGY